MQLYFTSIVQGSLLSAHLKINFVATELSTPAKWTLASVADDILLASATMETFYVGAFVVETLTYMNTEKNDIFV